VTPPLGGGRPADERERFAAEPVARLATLRPDGRPHLVPIVFAVEGDLVWTAVDDKPKSTNALRRLSNIEGDPRVSLLVDRYTADWTQLWWVRADGQARVIMAGSGEEQPALDALVAKYAQYQRQRPPGPVVQISVERWTSWSAR